jgi:hypothetical protein
LLVCAAGSLLAVSTASAQNLLVNPSFDDNGGSLDGWIAFGNASADLDIFNSGPASAKMFGTFCGDFCVTGVFQAFPANEGLEFQMDCNSFVGSFDPIATGPIPDSNWAVMKIAFFDAPTGGTEIGFGEVVIGDVNTPFDVWTPHTVSAIAPVGTQRVEAFFLFLQPPANDGGSIFVDDASFTVSVGTVTGACCDSATGVCTEDVSEVDCVGAGNLYGGDNSTCGGLDPACGSCGENLYANPAFDENGGSLDGWDAFGNAFSTTDFSQSPPASAVLFGNFTGGFNVSGIVQSFNIGAGAEVKLDVSSFVNGGDPIPGTGAPDFNWVVAKIAYFNSANGGVEIGGDEVTIADGNSPLDAWQDFSVTGIAPAGTQRVEGLILYLQPGLDGGAVFVDDLNMEVVCTGEPVPTVSEWGLLITALVTFALGTVSYSRKKRNAAFA